MVFLMITVRMDAMMVVLMMLMMFDVANMMMLILMMLMMSVIRSAPNREKTNSTFIC